MATIDLSGLDDVIRDLDRLGTNVGKTIDKMLSAGGYAMKAKQQDVVSTSHRHILTGSMHDKIGYSNPKTVGSARQTTVYPRGADRKKTSNALKGFVLNYGSVVRGIVGDHWFDYGVYAATPEVEEAMRQTFEEEIDKIMED